MLGDRQILHRPDQDRRAQMLRDAAEAIEELDAIHARHHEIEHDRPRLQLLRRLER